MAKEEQAAAAEAAAEAERHRQEQEVDRERERQEHVERERQEQLERQHEAVATALLLDVEMTKEQEEKNATVAEEKEEVKVGVESKPLYKARGSIPFSSPMERTPSPMITRRTRGRSRKMANSNTTSTFDVASTLDMAGIQPGSSVSFQPGSSVFVLWKNGLYPAQILSKETNNTTSGGGEQQENNNAYFVHYDSYHDDFDSWVPLSRIYKITKQTQRVFELSNRGSDNEELEIDSSGGSRGGNTWGGRGGDSRASTLTLSHAMERRNRSRTSGGGTIASSTSTTNTFSTTSLTSTTTIDMGDIDSGVVFLPGSGVYVAWKMGLFHAKMLKRRKVSEETEYLVNYIGYSDSYDAWVPLSRIYEISPQTKRIFGRCKGVVLDRMGDNSSSSSTSEDDDDDENNELAGVETLSPKPKEPCNKNSNNNGNSNSHSNSNSKSNNNNRTKKTSGLFDVENVSPGVEFERGRAIYAEYKNVFYLGKMLKKRTRGKLNHQYFVHYDGFRKSSDAWVSTKKVYEINSQTKRLFNAQRK